MAQSSYGRPRWSAAFFVALAALALAPKANGAEARLAWDMVDDATGYKLYYDIDSGPEYSGTQANEGDSPIDYPLALLTDPTAPEVTLTGLPSCTVFYFAVTAYNDTGESDYSMEVSATLVARPEPVTATAAGEGGLRVSWPPRPNDDDGAIPRYRIHYDTNSHADWAPPDNPPYGASGSPVTVETANLSTPSSPSHVLTGLQLGTSYYVRVESRCDDDTGKYSEEASGESGDVGSGGSGGSGTGAAGSGNSGTGASSTGATGTGAASSGGSAAGGLSGTGNDGSADSTSLEDGGCGCALPGRGKAGAWALLGAAALAALGMSRRRASGRRARAT